MSHAALLVVSLLLAAFGVLILVVSKCASTAAIVAGSVFALLSYATAAPASFHRARCEAVALWRCYKDPASADDDLTRTLPR